MSKVTAEHAGEPDKNGQFRIVSRTEIIGPNDVCTDSSINLSPDKFQFIPLQDFTERSDINWNDSVSDIDKQLYVKYSLSREEIVFIEKMIKPI